MERVRIHGTTRILLTKKPDTFLFLEDDPKAAAKLNDVSKSDDYKKAVIEAKLENLEGDEVFQKELVENYKPISNINLLVKMCLKMLTLR